ncbi:MAG: diguanylate cyclase domain-containing protein [Cyanophyceae cyanobacterium]
MSAKILVVEDESIVAQDLQATLEYMGYSVPETADCGEEAIAKAADLKPDLALIDIRLIGEMDGIAAAERIGQFDIPVVYLTAYADEETLARAKVTQPLGYLLKPVEARDLRATIEMALYRQETERALRQNEHWLTTILRSIGDGVIVTDAVGRITYMNPTAETLTGWSFSEALGNDAAAVFRLINESTRKTIRNPVTQALAAGEVVRLPKHTLLIRKNGQQIPISDSAAPFTSSHCTTPMNDSQGVISGAVLTFRDVTEERVTEQALRRRAFYDPLTNLANRAWFTERLTDAVERVKRQPDYLFAVLFLDLDEFKAVNDTLGHLVGDCLLIAVASRLMQSTRPHDTVARFGGDEFAILLENLASVEEAWAIAQRIQQELGMAFNLEQQKVSINASIGIALSSPPSTVEEMIHHADTAMYRAKAKGKGCWEVFDGD